MANKDGFTDSVIRGWSGAGQARGLNTPLSTRISRCRKQISVWKRSNRYNADERIQVLRHRPDKTTCSPTVCLVT